MDLFKVFIVGFLAEIIVLFAMYLSKVTEVSYLNSYLTQKN